MQGLRRLSKSRTGDEAGAVTVVVALMISGVLLGMGALVIDVGALYSERRELQNGADFAALTVAGDCAVNVVACATTSASTAQTYADANANDSKATVDGVCGTATGLVACTGGKLGPWDCSATVPSGKYVQVRTSTKTAGSNTVLPPILSRTLVGNSGDAGHQVRACARATFGGLGSYEGFAVTISYCEWNAATANGTVFAPPPPYAAPFTAVAPFERVLKLHTTAGVPTCGGGNPGWNMPGGFGWLDDAAPADCQTTVNAGGVYGGNPGVSGSNACKDALAAAWTSRSAVVYIPIFDGTLGSGGGATYHLKGFAAFVITGYSLPGAKQSSWAGGPPGGECKGSDKCIYGFFTQGLVPAGATGGPTMGANTTQLQL